jgi:hypothetical protein
VRLDVPGIGSARARELQLPTAQAHDENLGLDRPFGSPRRGCRGAAVSLFRRQSSGRALESTSSLVTRMLWDSRAWV